MSALEAPRPREVILPDLDHVQRAVLESPSRWKFCPWGRRRGKSHLGVVALLQPAFNHGVAWWIWPTHPLGRAGWKVLRRLGLQLREGIEGIQIREVDRALMLPGRGEVRLRSADDPGNLVGELDGLQRVVFDEAGIIQERAWEESVRPALMDTEGDALFMGTPKGRNWFFRGAQRGGSEDPGDAAWMTCHQTTLDSPYISDEEKASLLADFQAGRISERVWQQEIMAEFLSDAGAVFRRVVEAATATPIDSAEDGSAYVIGVDWGKMKDSSAFVVVDVNHRRVVHIDRMVRMEYAIQRGRLEALAARFSPLEIIAERNAMGEPIIEELLRAGLPVTPFTTTEATKGSAIEALALAFETGTIEIPPDPVLIDELQGFEGKLMPNGRTRYTAGSGIHGGHGDVAMALSMAWTGVSSGPTVEVFFP